MPVRVLVLWAPILHHDNKLAAIRATGYLNDPRVTHFWDLWKFGVQHYSQDLSYPSDKEAWDIFVLYEPGVVWRDRAPVPAFWMQHHNLEFGEKYSQHRLETELRRIVQEMESRISKP